MGESRRKTVTLGLLMVVSGKVGGLELARRVDPPWSELTVRRRAFLTAPDTNRREGK
jgi:hypothetical protein